MNKKKKKNKIICRNKKIYFNYFIKKTFKAGLVLKGWEIKSIRKNMVDISNSYLIYKNFEIFLLNCRINPIKTTSINVDLDVSRTKKILLKKKEILFIKNNIQRKNYSLVPISMFWKKSWCKIKISLSKGKKNIDKREIKKTNTIKKELSRISKNFY
ncbi:SsrA-binding protein SmpB [Buchnera aphidicola]|uniref:SsrA-binding protein SmpB n=1 Tax=Buchnera aphidicola TaxID=9 RepID=UPI003463E9F9